MWGKKKFLNIGDTFVRISNIRTAKVLEAKNKIIVFEDDGRRHDWEFQSVEAFNFGKSLIGKALR